MSVVRTSTIFPKLITKSLNAFKFTLGINVSRSNDLLLKNKLLIHDHLGKTIFTPLLIRSINKLQSLMEQSMNSIGASRVQFPSLIRKEEFKKDDCDRLEMMLKVDSTEKDEDYFLAATCEEPICNTLSQIHITSDMLPLRIYQISTKFRRDTPRLGLLRMKEFPMKDLYTFDIDKETCLESYNEATKAYMKLFQKLDLPINKINAGVGKFGGEFSHEYILENDIGENKLLKCDKCNQIFDKDFEDHSAHCSGESFIQVKGIEVGHSFYLSTHFTKPYGVYNLSFGLKKKFNPLHMTCHGIGVTRLLASCLEYHSKNNRLNWPCNIEPYKIYLIGPKQKAEAKDLAQTWCNYLIDHLPKIPGLENEILYDDRSGKIKSIGMKKHTAVSLGIPIIIICADNANCQTPIFELYNTRSGEEFKLTGSELFTYIRKFVKQ